MPTHTDQALPLLPNSGSCALSHLGVIAARGSDAAHFLHNQLTQDFVLLDMQHARLAAFCNAKGRMQASMTGFKTSVEEVLLVMRADLLPQTLKRLNMFVMRSKVKLSDASAEWTVFGRFAKKVEMPSPWKLSHDDSGWSVSLYPACGVARFLCLTPAESPLADSGLDLSDWLLSDTLSGVGDVQAATFRGVLKRRTYLDSSALPLQVGQEIFHSSDASQPAGQVVQAVSNRQHGHWALVCLQTSSTEAGELHPADTPGSVLTLHPLPYTLREDI